MSTALDTGERADAGPRDGSHDKARAQKVAAERRRRRQIQNIVIRVVSLAVVLSLWEVLGSHIDPVLFTKPSLIAIAAVQMIVSGELWNYLAPSLMVLAIGLSLAAVIGIAVGLVLARFWVVDVALGVYITFLYSIPSVALVPLIVLWAGYRDHRESRDPVHVRLLPDDDQHLSGRQERRSEAGRGGPRVPLQRAPAVDQRRSCRARCRSSSRGCGSRSGAA